MIPNSVAYDKAYQLAIRIVKLCQYLNHEHREYVISKQVLRCGTSIGANLAEANGAISRADFSAKVSIAYKETLETKYWLSLLKDSQYLALPLYTSLFADADEIAKILFAILQKTRINC
ncbi:MAG: four helix bundle protein [Moraxellaceae bacterium]|nr:four helix bundle protein [Pseudomonadales bacterium]MCP5175359.1 four helix bundle protein [Moraxellaceae bacterium]MCP5177136.1 four helix bundle protein [Moraxellaceae bacterium]